MSNIAVRVDHIGKQYRIGAKQKNQRLTEVLASAVASPVAGIRRLFRPPTEEELIWAIRDISFEANRGDTIGIIGPNGAGKSTLLKVLARITNPTEGRAELYGRVGALLEVGTGFHQELTGRENVYLKGAMLGMKRHEISRKLDDIVEFAEIDEFLDTPVKRYSSGMGMRLGFAVSAHLDAEILIVDEVLAVGDVAFQNKCLGKMDDVTQDGRTVLFVSHNMASINRLCQRVMWLDHGTVRMDGDTKEVIEQYLLSASSHEGERVWEKGFPDKSSARFRLRAVRLVNEQGAVSASLDVAEPFTVEIEYEVLTTLTKLRLGFSILNTSGVTVFETFETDNLDYARPVEPGRYVTRCKVPSPLLNGGNYFLDISAGDRRVGNLAKVEAALACEIVDTTGQGAYVRMKRGGLVRANFEWRREQVGERAKRARKSA